MEFTQIWEHGETSYSMHSSKSGSCLTFEIKFVQINFSCVLLWQGVVDVADVVSCVDVVLWMLWMLWML